PREPGVEKWNTMGSFDMACALPGGLKRGGTTPVVDPVTVPEAHPLEPRPVTAPWLRVTLAFHFASALDKVVAVPTTPITVKVFATVNVAELSPESEFEPVTCPCGFTVNLGLILPRAGTLTPLIGMGVAIHVPLGLGSATGPAST